MECTLREVLWQMRGVEAQQWRVQKRHRGAGLSLCGGAFRCLVAAENPPEARKLAWGGRSAPGYRIPRGA